MKYHGMAFICKCIELQKISFLVQKSLKKYTEYRNYRMCSTVKSV